MFAGDVEVDEVLTNNDVGNTITIICHLKEQGKFWMYISKWWKWMSCPYRLFYSIIMRWAWKQADINMLSVAWCDLKLSTVRPKGQISHPPLAKNIFPSSFTVTDTSDDLPDQILLQRTHILDVWPDQTTQVAAEGFDWWTASKAQTEPEHRSDIPLVHSWLLKYYTGRI